LSNILLIFDSFWVGMSDIITEGTWRWIGLYPSNNGALATNATAIWALREPRERTLFGHTLCDCAEIASYQTLKLSSWPCSYFSNYICEKAL